MLPLLLLSTAGFAAPIIMGLILGELVENTLKQSLLIFEQNWLMFFQRPIVVTFFVLTVVGLFGPAVMAAYRRRRDAAKESAG